MIVMKAKFDGKIKDIPMFSRAGKSTTSQYLAFAESADAKSAAVAKGETYFTLNSK